MVWMQRGAYNLWNDDVIFTMSISHRHLVMFLDNVDHLCGWVGDPFRYVGCNVFNEVCSNMWDSFKADCNVGGTSMGLPIRRVLQCATLNLQTIEYVAEEWMKRNDSLAAFLEAKRWIESTDDPVSQLALARMGEDRKLVLDDHDPPASWRPVGIDLDVNAVWEAFERGEVPSVPIYEGNPASVFHRATAEKPKPRANGNDDDLFCFG